MGGVTAHCWQNQESRPQAGGLSPAWQISIYWPGKGPGGTTCSPLLPCHIPHWPRQKRSLSKESTFALDIPFWGPHAQSKLCSVIANSICFLVWDFKPAPATRLSPRTVDGPGAVSGPFSKVAGWCPVWRCCGFWWRLRWELRLI